MITSIQAVWEEFGRGLCVVLGHIEVRGMYATDSNSKFGNLFDDFRIRQTKSRGKRRGAEIRQEGTSGTRKLSLRHNPACNILPPTREPAHVLQVAVCF